MTKLQYKDYTVEIFWEQECFGWFYDIYPRSPEVKMRDHLGSDSETEALQAAKDRIDQELAKS
ncbi:MAG: hypothetical protein V7K27_00165 [Nostoc sp.]|uniref:hypothetical protein n=1 Tax=Nostoc sp. TaxID=1180 RepID=UPI002FF9F6C8